MHPTIKIIYLVMLAVLINFVHASALLWLALAMLVLLVHYRYYNVIKMVMRARWLFLSLILVYAFDTPGEYIHHWPIGFSPTYEGIIQGSLQILRIIVMMTGLALLTATTSRQNLITGFYQLLTPVRWVHLSPERFAARLWLTLRYAEQQLEQVENPVRQAMIKHLEDSGSHEFGRSLESIEILMPGMRVSDICMLILLIPVSYLVL